VTQREDPPFLFVLGSGRSGTTLLLAMLDSHPDLAIPAETGGFMLQTCDHPPLSGAGVLDIDAFLERVFQNERLQLWGLDAAALRQNLLETEPRTAPQGFRALYRFYAAAYGKSRYGDKTPNYVLKIPELSLYFPESRFVHVIRDGRDVALALRDVPFGPDTVEGCAEYWMTRVIAGRSTGQELGEDRYLEVRYEELVADPGAVLHRIVTFVDLPDSPAMLDYEEAAQRQLQMSPSPEEDQSLLQPLNPRLRDWRTQMSDEETKAFEAVAGDLLADLGYPVTGVDEA
jgi:hypothetical protein